MAEITMNDVFGDLVRSRPLLEPIVQNKFITLDTCKATATSLLQKIERLIDEFIARWGKAQDNEKAAAWDKPIGFSDLSELRELIRAFEYVFSAEVSNASLYFVEQIGAYQTRTLVDNADMVFPKNVREKLASDATVDIKSAGRALAFELPTAAGFHICRALETTLLQYFSTLNIDLPQYKNLGRYIEALQKIGKEKNIDPKVLAALDQFRDLHRNPIMHPDVHLNMDEAQILFALAQSAISSVVLDITKIQEQQNSSLPAKPTSAVPGTTIDFGQSNAASGR